MAADLFSAALDFEESAVNRATTIEMLPDLHLRLCTAEDLMVMKAFADRPLDWEDMVSVARRQRGRLDWRYVYAQLEPLAELKGAPELVTRLRRLQRENG